MILVTSLINRLFVNSLIVILVVTALLFCDKIMWSFHSPKDLFLQFAILGVLTLHFLRPKTIIRINFLDTVILLRLALIILFLVLIGNIKSLFQELDILVYLTLFYFFIQLCDSPTKYFDKSFSLLVFIGTLLSIYGILQYCGYDIFHPEGYSYYESRVIGTFGNANTMGGFLAAIFPFSVHGWFFSANKSLKGFYIVCSCLIITAIILTLSRGAWLALSGVFFIVGTFLIIKNRKIFLPKKVYKIGGVVLFTSIMFFGGWQVYQLNPDSATGRIFLWRISSDMIADHPFTGIGYGQYGTHYLDYQANFFDDPANAVYFDRAANIKQAHNEYIQVFAETGIMGFALFLFIFVLFYINVFKILRTIGNDNKEGGRILALTASMTVIAIHSIVDSPLHTLPINLIFYFALGFVSLKAKQVEYKGEIPSGESINLPDNYSKRSGIRFSFNNRFVFPLIGLFLFSYNSYDVFQKLQGYIHWQNGQNQVAVGDWYKGIKEYEKANDILSNIGELKFHLGAAYAYTQQPEKALDYLKRSQDNFNDKNIYVTQGAALLQLERYEKAEESFKTALRMYPKLLLPRLWLAEMYIKLGEIQAAVIELTTIITIKPKVVTDEIRSIKKDAGKLLEIYAAGKNH